MLMKDFPKIGKKGITAESLIWIILAVLALVFGVLLIRYFGSTIIEGGKKFFDILRG